jgi:hypothetical protein
VTRKDIAAIGIIVGILWSASAQAAETHQLGGGFSLRPVSGVLLEIRKDGKRLWSCVPKDGDRDETECTLARTLPRIADGAVLIQSADIWGRVPKTCTLVVPGKQLDIHAYPSWQPCADTVKDVDGDGSPEFLTPSTYVPRSVGAEDDYPFAAFVSLVPLAYSPDTGLQPKLASLRRPVSRIVADICRSHGLACTDAKGLACTDAKGLAASWDGADTSMRDGVPLALWGLVFALVESGNGADLRKTVADGWRGNAAGLDSFLRQAGRLFAAENLYAKDFIALNGGRITTLGLPRQ